MCTTDNDLRSVPDTSKLPTMAGPALYLIRIRGHLEPDLASRLGDLEVESVHDEEGKPVATLRGVLADQAALAGLVKAFYTFHLPILAIECLGATEPTVPSPSAAGDPSTTK